MDKIKSAFEGKKVNIGYIVAGYPSVEHTREFLSNLDDSVIDILELGIPYSDPLADGKVIFDASFKAVQDGVNTDTIFEILSTIKTKKALVFLVYYNLIFAYGIDKFLQKSKECGISGFVIPDLPFEENEEIFNKANALEMALIPLISVTSAHRTQMVLTRSSGFIYAIGSIGVTGSKQTPLNRLKDMVKEIKSKTNMPVAVGFGIRTKEDVIMTKEYADGAIMGTSIVNLSAKFSGAEFLDEIKKLFV